jgi:hypothetical protein
MAELCARSCLLCSPQTAAAEIRAEATVMVVKRNRDHLDIPRFGTVNWPSRQLVETTKSPLLNLRKCGRTVCAARAGGSSNGEDVLSRQCFQTKGTFQLAARVTAR